MMVDEVVSGVRARGEDLTGFENMSGLREHVNHLIDYYTNVNFKHCASFAKSNQ